MAQITLLSAPSWSVLHAQRASWLDGLAGKALFLIPHRQRLQTVQEAFPDCAVLSTQELLRRYVAHQCGQSQLLARPAINYILFSIVSSTDVASTTTRYLDIETFYQGYVRALTDLILDFRENGPDNFLQALSSFKNAALSARERDLVDIHDEFENFLDQHNLFDYRRAALALIKDKEHGKPEIFLPEFADAHLVIYGFDHLTSLESKLLGRILFRFRQSVIAFCSNPMAAPATFSGQQTVGVFINNVKSVFAERYQETELKASPDRPLVQLAERIFNDEKPSRMAAETAGAAIYSGNSRYAEMTFIARQIRALHDQGMAFEEMRLVAPNYETYVALALEVLPRYAIPFRLGPGTPLTFYPLARLIANMINHGITPSPFALREQIFASPYVTFSDAVPAEALEKFIVELGAQTQVDLQQLKNQFSQPQTLRLNYEALISLQRKASQATRSPENLAPVQRVLAYFGQQSALAPERRQDKVLAALVQYYLLARAERALYVWSAEMTPAAFTRAVEKLLHRFAIESNLLTTDQADLNPGPIVLQDQKVLAQVRQILQRLEAQFTTLAAADKKIPLASLAQAFTNFLVDPDCYLVDEATVGLTVYAGADTALTTAPITFMVGLLDGELPAQPPFNFLQPRYEGRTLAGAISQLDQDRIRFYQLIAATGERLFVTFPLADSDKKSLTSPFVAEMEKCYDKSIRIEAASTSRLYSQRERLSQISRQVDRNYAAMRPGLQELKRNAPDLYAQMIAILRCDGLRGNVEAFSQFDGMFRFQPAQTAIASQLGETFAYDVEKIERFAGCPLRFLFDDLMHLRPEYWIDYHPDTTERGRLIRSILIAYSREAAAAGKIPVDAADILARAATSALAEFWTEKDDHFGDRFKHMLTMGLQPAGSIGKKRPGLLASFLEAERIHPDLVEPFLADLHFRSGPKSENRFQIEAIPIDVDIDTVMQTSTGDFLIIYNYSIADLGDIEGIFKGLGFRLPLQILALQDYLAGQRLRKTVAGAGYYLVKNFRNIKRGGYLALQDLQASTEKKVSPETPIYSAQRKYGFLPKDNFHLLLDLVRKRMVRIDGQIRAGRFHLPLCAGRDLICDNCHFSRICRIEQLRLDRIYSIGNTENYYTPLRRANQQL